MTHCGYSAPWLGVVSEDDRSVVTVRARPTDAPRLADGYPATVRPLGWSKDGSKLLYAWEQYYEECRGIGWSGASILATETTAHESQLIASVDSFGYETLWSPTDDAAAVAEDCGPLAWNMDGTSLAVVAFDDGCTVTIVDGGKRVEAELTTDSNMAKLFRVKRNSGEPTELRTVQFGPDAWPYQIGTLPDDQGIVGWVDDFATLTRTDLVVLPLDGSAPVHLPTLKSPRGMELGYIASAG